MRIAYIVPYVPNLVRTRPYNLIRHLTSLGHEVAVFTVGSNKQDRADAQGLASQCAEVHYHSQPVWRSLLNSAAALPSKRPLQSVYSWQPRLAFQVAQLLARKEYHIVHVEHLRGSQYGSYLKTRFPTQSVVWDSVDCISQLFRQAASQNHSLFGKIVTRLEIPRTEISEGKLVRAFDRVLVTSSADREALLQLTPRETHRSGISVVPNGVDLEYFRPNPEYQQEPETIVFTGKMSYHANVAMARYLTAEIMPRIWRRRPTARLYVVGKDPPLEIQKLGRNPQITVTGTVDDIRPSLWRATVSVVPLLYGAGIQNKILEAMAAGTPVVSSYKALRALHAQPGEDLLASEGADEFAQAVLQLMDDHDLQCRLREAGLTYVRAFHNWSQIASELADIYQQVLDSKKYTC